MIDLEVVTPERKIVDQTVEMVTVPTGRGEIGILTDHAPLISTLKPGILSFVGSGGTDRIVVSGGFVEVRSNRVSVLADAAERISDVDVEAAKSEMEEVRGALGDWKGPAADFEAELEKLEFANARINLATKK